MTFNYNVNSHIRFIIFIFLVSDVVAPPLVAIKGVHWAKDVPKFVFMVDGCDASYIAKYNLVWHLSAHHNVTMELGKPKCPST
jgi:hypothetical protein